jgi:hypothetical protein
VVSDCRLLSLRIGPKENGCPKYSLEGGDQSAVLGTALLHSENIQHLRGTPKRDRLRLLSHGECRQENGNQSILAPGHPVLRMAGNLPEEVSVLLAAG